MTDLIRELANQATVAVTKPDGHYIVQAWQAKFAELIVRECGKSCTLQGDEDDMFQKFGIKHN